MANHIDIEFRGLHGTDAYFCIAAEDDTPTLTISAGDSRSNGGALLNLKDAIRLRDWLNENLKES